MTRADMFNYLGAAAVNLSTQQYLTLKGHYNSNKITLDTTHLLGSTNLLVTLHDRALNH